MTPADRPGDTGSLFDDLPVPPDPTGHGSVLVLGEQAVVLRGLALPMAGQLKDAIEQVAAQAPWRTMVTPGGLTMSVSMTNCGALGWTSDRRGYRYSGHDPLSGRPWPAIPAPLRQLAAHAAAQAGFQRFEPDACLINTYLPGARLSLHQDRDERDLGAPIVSVSLGLPATFLFGGSRRADPAARVALCHGDVVVWGGVDRLRFHGVAPVKKPAPGLHWPARWNLTFRKAG